MYHVGIPASFLFQTISVSVSVLTLSCIAQDRWYAICHPLMFKSTARRARTSIVIIWVVSCVTMIPQAVVMESSSLLPELTNKTSLFTVCDEHWGGSFSQICLEHVFILWYSRFLMYWKSVLGNLLPAAGAGETRTCNQASLHLQLIEMDSFFFFSILDITLRHAPHSSEYSVHRNHWQQPPSCEPCHFGAYDCFRPHYVHEITYKKSLLPYIYLPYQNRSAEGPENRTGTRGD